MRRNLWGCSLLASLLCGAAALSGCNQGSAGAPPPPLAALPPTASGPPLAQAPEADQLPPAPAPRLVRVSSPGDEYAFADRAYAMDVAFADLPPDYDFYEDGSSPWVWVTDDGSECIAELTPIGWRYYYYDPGVSEPFFIEDPEYGYGFESGALVVVYDHAGREFSGESMPGQAQIAGQFLTRATLLRQASAHDPHRAVAAADWAAHRDVIAAPRSAWSQTSAHVPAWSDYRAQHAAQDQAHWNGERLRREAWAARVDSGLGDPRRAAAEWRTAAAQASQMAEASGRGHPTWAGWRGAPPPVGSTGAHAAPAEHPFAAAGPIGGFLHPQGGGRAPLRETMADTPAGTGFGPHATEHPPAPHDMPDFHRAPAPAPHLALRGPPPRFERAPSATNFGSPAAARVPERATEHVATPHVATPHFATSHVATSHVATSHVASPHVITATAHVAAPAVHAAPHASTPAAPAPPQPAGRRDDGQHHPR